LHGEAQPIRVAAAVNQESMVGSGETIKPGQGVRIVWDAEEQPALFLGQQLSMRHGLLLRPKNVRDDCGRRRFTGRILWTEGRRQVDFR